MNDPAPARFTTTHWLICIIASIGFAFDIYELLMLPLIIKPAMASLSQPLINELVAGGMAREAAAQLFAPGGKEYVHWARLLFFVPALAGGVFGMLGGYLTDRLGRRRVLTWSILLYAFSAFAAGWATSLPMLLLLRCGVFVGVCVEFVAAVAWLAELFPDPKRRERVLGYTQAFSSLGGLMVGFANVAAAKWALDLPAIQGGHEAWRYTLISGIIPALPLIIIRPFLPESPVWKRKRLAGQLKRPSFAELFSPQLRLTTIVTTLAFAGSYGIAFGAIQQMPQILGAPHGHAAVKEIAQEASRQAAAEAQEAGQLPLSPGQLRQAAGNASDEAVAKVTIWQEIGGLTGRVLFAFLAVLVLSRRNLFRLFQIPALLFVPLFFLWMPGSLDKPETLKLIKAGAFIAGLFVVAQFSFWGNYIPRVFPIHLRGTGESFAANIGGRVLGTAAAFLTLTFAASSPPNPGKIAVVAAIVAALYGLLAAALTFLLPEPPARDEEAEAPDSSS
ncbi:MAG TPA: MFS transporter [Verrucomicrobiales bacterium]|nr:MFS transporter [Verrucomicrobiales bacterium]